eukprot:scaffold7040_cov66-Phaeocystis_antarctica.AAC.13
MGCAAGAAWASLAVAESRLIPLTGVLGLTLAGTLGPSHILDQRLRTDESERPGSLAAIRRHLQPKVAMPSQIMRSSSAVHTERPWALPVLRSSDEPSEWPSSKPGTPEYSSVVFCSRCAATRSHCVPSLRTQDKMIRFSSSVQVRRGRFRGKSASRANGVSSRVTNASEVAIAAMC